MNLTRLDNQMSHRDLLTAYYLAFDSFWVHLNLLKTYIINEGTCDGNEVGIKNSKLHDTFSCMPDVPSVKIAPNAFVLDLDLLGIDASKLAKAGDNIDERIVVVQPPLGLPIAPLVIDDLFYGDGVHFFIYDPSEQTDKSDDIELILYDPQKTKLGKKAEIAQEITLDPNAYMAWVMIIHRIVEYRLMPLRPILASYGHTNIQLPQWSFAYPTPHRIFIPPSALFYLNIGKTESSTG